MDTQEKKREYEELLAASKAMKRRMLQILAILGGVMLLMLAVVIGVHFAFAGEEENASPQIDFYAPYDGDIFSFDEYLALDRSTSYFDGYVYRSIEEENEKSFDGAVLFLRDFLEMMKRGDVKGYNAAFTVDPHQSDFSQQMIYEAAICYERQGTDAQDRLILYRLEYKLHRNDGSLRRDVGSDGMKPLWAVVRVTPDGVCSLDSLTGESPK